MSEFFTSSSVADLLKVADKSVDYEGLSDIQSLHHVRNEVNKILAMNNMVSDSVKCTLELLVILVNNEMDKLRKTSWT
tara:strand:- start:759 stop:992 length:234 start_codon:yes stop_codon:yes gene_type:complete